MYNISLEDVKEMKVLVAPLNEQRRIVAKLEKLLDKVEACQQRLAKIPIILKRFRQSVLAAACSGRLTADWRERNPNLEPAIELLKRIREKRKRENKENMVITKDRRLRSFAKNHQFSILEEQSSVAGWAKVKIANLIYIAGRIGWRGLKA